MSKLIQIYLIINLLLGILFISQSSLAAIFPHSLPNSACYTELPDKYLSEDGSMCVDNPDHIGTSFPFYVSLICAILITIALPIPMLLLWIV